MDKISLVILQTIFLLLAAPFFSGLIAKVKNNLRLRQGQSIWQPYYNLIKLFSKQEVVSQTASWIFRAAPFIVFASALCGAYLIPLLVFHASANYMGDLLAFIFILALGRFFLALAALDTGSAFGGMGSSREMFISSLVEPAFCLVVFAIFLKTGSTDPVYLWSGEGASASLVIAGAALFLITLAETSRIPVDNQETHLELTMIHEAMVLEYSGKSLALIEMSSYIKQMVFFFLIAQIVFPVDPARMHPAFWLFWCSIRLAVISLITAVVEVSLAKMRLFRAADFLGFAFVLGLTASICAMLGV